MTDAQGARRRQQQAVVWTEDFFFFPPFRLLLRRTPTRSERGATGNHYSVLQGPGPFNTHPPSSICSNRHMDLWFLFQRVSGKQMRCCWYARSGTALTGSLLLFFFFFFFAYNPSTPQVINSSTDSGAVHYYADSWRYEFALSQLVPSEVCFRWFQHSRVQRFLLADLAPLLRKQPSCSAGLKQCVLFLATSRGLFDVNDFTDSACDTPLTHWTLLTSVHAGETLAGVDIMMNCTPSLSGVWPWENKISQMLMSCGRFQGPLN